jgi:hypothetical protein
MSEYQDEAWKQSQAQANREWRVAVCPQHPWVPAITNRDGSVKCGFLGESYNNVPPCNVILKAAKKPEEPPADNYYEPGADIEETGWIKAKEELNPGMPEKIESHGYARINKIGGNAYVREQE